MQHINTLHFDGDDNFTKNFNTCTEYYLITIDENKSVDERQEAFNNWFNLKKAMEEGYAN